LDLKELTSAVIDKAKALVDVKLVGGVEVKFAIVDNRVTGADVNFQYSKG
jgi:hypothetical protein